MSSNDKTIIANEEDPWLNSSLKRLPTVSHGNISSNECYTNHNIFTAEHERKLNNSFGRQLVIDYSDIQKGFTFDVIRPSFPKKLRKAPVQKAAKVTRYVRVYGNFWEQMTMSVRALISLAGLAKLGGRKVLIPRVGKRFLLGRKGKSLATHFNMTHFNNLLDSCDYATLIDNREYEAECSLANASHVAIYFLFKKNIKSGTKRDLKLNEKKYNDLKKLTKKVGWIQCPDLKTFVKERANSKYFCVDVEKVTEWMFLEKEIVKGAKCLTISRWRGTGSVFRAHFTRRGLTAYEKDILFELRPSDHVLHEAQNFRRSLPDRYIAIQVRGEHIVNEHGIERLLICLHLLTDFVKILKAATGISKLLVASDMSEYGSRSWKKLAKQNREYHHRLLISSIGGVQYKPTAEHPDRGVVALIEMTLIAHAQHLVTVGSGSFQEWIRAKFLQEHRNDLINSWSLVTICLRN